MAVLELFECSFEGLFVVDDSFTHLQKRACVEVANGYDAVLDIRWFQSAWRKIGRNAHWDAQLDATRGGLLNGMVNRFGLLFQLLAMSTLVFVLMVIMVLRLHLTCVSFSL
jgi:hypothetical protein